MMWSDYARSRPEEFVKRCPKSVVQNVWYYFNKYGEDIEEKFRIRIMPIKALNEAGFDQIPTGSIEYDFDSLQRLAEYSAEHIDKKHLLGFMQTTWAPVLPHWKYMLDKGNEATKEAIAAYNSKLAELKK